MKKNPPAGHRAAGIRTKQVSIFVPSGNCILSSIVGSYKVFSEVNRAMQQQYPNEPLPFQIQLVGIQKETSLYGGAFNIRPHATIDQVRRTDLLIVPAIVGDYAAEIRNNAAVIPWIIEQYKQGAEIASLCTGAFLVAATGLLKNKKCATHWAAFDAFRAMFPDVEPQKAVVHEEDGICSSGGAYSFLNLILHLVEKYVNREMAVHCSKIFEIEIDRYSQASFAVFNGSKMHTDTAVTAAQAFIEKNYADKISVDGLARHCSLSRRNFERRFKKATHYSPAEYIQYLKIEAARKQLETSRYHVNEVMYAVGYSDNKAFRTTFKKITGLSPLAYKNRFQAYGA